MTKINISENQERLARLAKAIGHPTRVAILEFLAQRKDCFFGDIHEVLPISKATVSQHLSELKEAGLIQGVIEPPKVRYCLNCETWKEAKSLFSTFFDKQDKEMKTIEIFDPAMCCPTGLCGTNIDPNLMRIAVIVDTLKKKGINIIRHNLKDEPAVYVSNAKVNELLQSKGVEALPITIVDGEVTVVGEYPSTSQLSEWTGVNLSFIPMPEDKTESDNNCCCC